MGQLQTSDDKEWGDCDEQGIGPFASNIFKRGIDLGAGVGVEDLDCQPERASRRFNLTGGERDWSIAEQRYP